MYSCAISTNLSAPFVIFKYHRQYHKTLIYNIHVFQVSRPTLILCCVFIIPSPTKLRRDIVTLPSVLPSFLQSIRPSQGWIQDFKLGGAYLKKLLRAEEGTKIFGVFRVKNHYFTPKKNIFSNCGGRREHFWGISCEKSRFYAKKSYFLHFRGGGRALDPPLLL